MSLSRNNHYIPKMYLKRWMAKDRIPTYHLLVSHDKIWIWSRESIKHAGSLPNLYVNIRKKEELDDLEHYIDTVIESPAKIPFDKLCIGEKLSSEDWVRIADYIAIQYVRTPAFYLWAKDFGADIIKEQIDIIGSQIENMKEPPQKKRDIPKGVEYLPIDVKLTDIKPDDDHTYLEISAVSGKGLWLYLITLALNDDFQLRKYFRQLRWNVISAPDGQFWPTCDNPVVVCDVIDNTIKRSSVSEGLLGKTKAILFPISPEKVILATTVKRYKWLNIQADEKLAEMIQRAIINNAMLSIYSKDEDSRIPLIRPRTVDENAFNRVKNEFDNWFDSYKGIEGPLLNR